MADNKILKICMEKGFLLDKEMLGMFSSADEESVKEIIENFRNLEIKERVITKTIFSKNMQKIRSILVNGKTRTTIENIYINLGYSRSELESSDGKGIAIGDGKIKEESISENLGSEINSDYVKILHSPDIAPKKVSVEDFVKHFNARYNQIKKYLQEKDIEGLTSLRKIDDRKGNFSIIVAILDKRVTKNKNIILSVEDPTGKANVLVNQNKSEIFEAAKNLLPDDIVAIKVSGNSEWLYANEIIFPDCYLAEKRRDSEDKWVAFSSDLHTGSSMCLENNFLKFVRWLNGEEGDEKQKEIAKKVKYLFFVGDNVDGVGVYPEQNLLLKIKDLRDQYKKLAENLNKIRSDIKIIMCPGQHDCVRVAEPQPVISEDYAADLYKMKNMTFVSNPAIVEISGGFKILMYHGASMHGFVEEIEDIRVNHGHNNPTLVVRELLKRRHLCSMHGSVTYIPSDKEDPMVITIIPDIVLTGDWHRPEVSMHNNILLIASSCWQSKTPFEEKVGHNPDPCKVPIFNLKTREIKILDFSSEDEKSSPLEKETSERKESPKEQKCEEKKEGEIVCEVKKTEVGK
jgi:DNA polymerase II small subunit